MASLNTSDSATVSDSPGYYSELVATREQLAVYSNVNPTVSDSTSISESIVMLIPGLFVSISDSTTASETLAESKVSFVSVQDAVSISESFNQLIPVLVVSVSDATTATEVATVSSPLCLITVSDSTVISEVCLELVPEYLVGVQDSIATNETRSLFVPVYKVSVSDSTSINEIYSINTVGAIYPLPVSDSITTGESLGYYSELIAIRDQVFVALVDCISLTESVSTSETINVFLPYFALKVTDSVSTTTTSLSPQNTWTAGLFGGIYLGESSFANSSNTFFLPNDIVNVTQANQVQVLEAISTSESYIEDVPVNLFVQDTTVISEVLALPIVSYITVADSTSTSENSAIILPFVLVMVSETVMDTDVIFVNLGGGIFSFDQSIVSELISVITVIDPVIITDSTVTSETYNVAIANQIAILETVSSSENLVLLNQAFIKLSDSTVTSEQIKLLKLLFVSISDLTTISETFRLVSVSLVNAGEFSTATDTLVIMSLGLVHTGDSTTVSENTNVALVFIIKTLELVIPTDLVNVAEVDTLSVTDFIAISDNIIPLITSASYPLQVGVVLQTGFVGISLQG